jgi:hypothetical protein
LFEETMEASSRAADYAQLQREYRNMELNRKAYADESNQMLRRQQADIEKLRKDNGVLNDALKGELGGLLLLVGETWGRTQVEVTQTQTKQILVLVLQIQHDWSSSPFLIKQDA